MRLASLALICAAACLVIPAEAAAFKYTHRVTATASLTDNWTVSDTAFCADVGSGSVSLQMTTTGPTKIRPFISRTGSRPVTKGSGLWVLGVPVFGNVTHMPPRKAKGSLTLVDNTVPNEADCETYVKRDCGTFPATGSLFKIGGYDLRHLYGNMFINDKYLNNSIDCVHGALDNWSRPPEVSGGDNSIGDMVFKMPTMKKFKRKRSLTLTKTDHKVSTTVYSNSKTFTDDVTRTLTIKIEKL